MKNTWMLILLVVSFSASSDIGFKVSQIQYGLGSYGSFNFEAYQAVYERSMGSYTGSVSVGQSDKDQGNYIRNFWVLSFKRNFRLSDRFSANLGYNFTEYKACSDAWGCNPDTGQGISVGVQYRINSNLKLNLDYDDYYTKQSKTLGQEKTTGNSLSLIARF